MKKRKRHLRKSIKNALQVVAEIIICAILVATFLYGMILHGATMQDRYADPVYCEVRGK